MHLKRNYFSPKLSYHPSKYIPELDGIRGIAISLVIFYHCFGGEFTGLGWVGVDLFFVLSGFLITGILLDSKGKKKYYVNFIGRRVLRIFPLFYLVLFLMLFVIPRVGPLRFHSDFDFYIQHQGWFWAYIQNWLYSFHGFPKNLILFHFWSLAVEEQFYLFWPWVIFFIPDRHLLKVSIILCMAAIVFRLLPIGWFHFTATYRYVNTISRMDALLIGGIIAQMARRKKPVLEKVALPVGIFGLAVFMAGIIINKTQRFMELPAYYTAIDLFMGLILFLSVSDLIRFRKILRIKPLIFLGRYSYGLYVYHYILYILLRYKFGPWLTVHFPHITPGVAKLALGIATVFLSLIISFLSYHLFEVHFLRLKTYFRNTASRDLLSKDIADSDEQIVAQPS